MPLPAADTPGSYERVGEAGAWKGTLVGTGHAGRLYTIDAGGALYATDPQTGNWRQIGKADFANTSRLFSAGASLLSLEKDGSLYRVTVR
jgi:hypothetical protein